MAAGALEAVAGEHGQHGPEQALRGIDQLGVSRIGRPLQRRIETGSLAGELPVGGRERDERVVARAPDGRVAEPLAHLAHATQPQVAPKPAQAVDVVVERRRPYPQLRGDGAEGERVEPVPIRQARGGVDHHRAREPVPPPHL